MAPSLICPTAIAPSLMASFPLMPPTIHLSLGSLEQKTVRWLPWLFKSNADYLSKPTSLRDRTSSSLISDLILHSSPSLPNLTTLASFHGLKHANPFLLQGLLIYCSLCQGSSFPDSFYGPHTPSRSLLKSHLLREVFPDYLNRILLIILNPLYRVSCVALATTNNFFTFIVCLPL